MKTHKAPSAYLLVLPKIYWELKEKVSHVKDMWYTRWHAFGDWGRELSEKKLLKSS